MSAEEKKHHPTQRRVRDAKDRGDVAFSRELSSALGTLAAIGVLGSSGLMIVSRLMHEVVMALNKMGDAPARDIAPGDLSAGLFSSGALIAATAGPIALAAAGTGMFTGMLQTRFNYSTKKLQIHWDRLSPQNGIQRLAPSKAGIDTLKAILVATVIGIFAWKAGKGLLVDAAHLTFSTPLQSAERGWSDATRLLWQAGFVLLVFGALDFGLQKYRHLQKMKMTDEEFRQDMKQESNPQIKGRIRRIQRELHRKRMLQNVKKATVIITNPTHFAVALEYNREKNPAPVVVAKGADRVAAKIRELGRQHSIPIMENPPLARALFKECEVGDTIPGPLFGAVAEILAYLIRIKQLVI